ncbi:glycine cleavage system protein H [Salinigranum rubrum]|uniref:Probable glycine cleavage system H protein n=1 Tax=Salinigranum rubrum TaxID=755307 RepID=A0A2I8VQ25_9EURY|nr:glycine cleavage system protein H [Salinigranum rubrum]
MFEVPDDRRYLESHEWITTADPIRVGITEFAQDELGDVVFVELPETGDTVTADDSFGVVESIKAVSDLYAPVSGEVTAVNEELFDRPELVNESPYDEGWMLELSVEGDEAFDDLLSPRSTASRSNERESVRTARARRDRVDARCGRCRRGGRTVRHPRRRRVRRRVRNQFEIRSSGANRGRGDALAQPRPRRVSGSGSLRPLRPVPGFGPLSPVGVSHLLHAVPARDHPGLPAGPVRVPVVRRRVDRTAGRELFDVRRRDCPGRGRAPRRSRPASERVDRHRPRPPPRGEGGRPRQLRRGGRPLGRDVPDGRRCCRRRRTLRTRRRRHRHGVRGVADGPRGRRALARFDWEPRRRQRRAVLSRLRPARAGTPRRACERGSRRRRRRGRRSRTLDELRHGTRPLRHPRGVPPAGPGEAGRGQ